MTRARRLSPWYWIVLGVFLAVAALSITNQAFDWEQEWISAASPIVTLAASIYTFRLLWKQSDHPAFHSDRFKSDAKRTQK